MIVNLYVPVAGSRSCASIDPGSAIVGSPTESRVLIDYEGNRYDAVNMRRFEEKVLHAADRHRTQYPTMARRSVPADELHLVGSYNTDTRELVVTDEPALSAWKDAS